MIDRLDIIIAQVRELSGTKDFGDQYGYTDELFVISANKANRSLQRHLVKECVEVYATYQTIDTVANQEAYAIPSNCFARHLVHSVEYSQDGTFFDTLNKAYSREVYSAGTPSQYVIDGGYVYVWPIPSISGQKIRLRFEEKLPGLDLIRGQIESLPGVAMPSPTLIRLRDNALLDTTKLSGAIQWVNVVDRDGNFLCKNIPVSSYDSTNRDLSVLTGFTAASGETIPVDALLTTGYYATTHPVLDNCCYDYFTEFMKLDVYELQSSEGSMEANPKLMAILQEIVSVYETMPAGKSPINEARGNW